MLFIIFDFDWVLEETACMTDFESARKPLCQVPWVYKELAVGLLSVSYTHLDVYKRQHLFHN